MTASWFLMKAVKKEQCVIKRFHKITLTFYMILIII